MNERHDDKRPVEVSVIVLTYRQASTIGRAIESVLAQKTDFEYEIILSDDCSPDITGEICRSYADRFPDRIRLVERSENVGVVEGYFDCLSKARGRFVADCAGDDYWMGNDRLQSLYDMIANDDTVSLAHGDWVELNAESGEISDPFGGERRYEPLSDGRSVLNRLFAHEHPVAVHLSTALYRRSIVEEALASTPSLVHNPSYGCEDFPVMAALLSHGKAAYLHRPVLVYRVGGASVSNPAKLHRYFTFYEQTAQCTSELAIHYGIDKTVIAGFGRERIKLLMSVACRLHDRELFERVEALCSLYGDRGGWKTGLRRLYMKMTT